ncbi:MAG: hypothetical protein JW954_08490 [Dehalococcoidaceae bacterium]|nr:hypothetical protein [Dehalococcoidaceae bacterium]
MAAGCLLACMVSCGGCAEAVFPLPVFEQAPPVLEVEKLLSEYRDDPVAAERNYKGKTYLFPQIRAESMMSQYMGLPRYNINDLYLQYQQVRFLPKTTLSLDHVGPGFVVDIVGEIRGWIGAYFVIDNCTYIVAEGGDLPAAGGY